jgi:outer membrane lipoprotein SlyB
MTKITMSMVVVLALTVAAPAANAKGCIKGAVVGGVAGHYVGGGHGVLGAAAGCLVGRHYVY